LDTPDVAGDAQHTAAAMSTSQVSLDHHIVLLHPVPTFEFTSNRYYPFPGPSAVGALTPMTGIRTSTAIPTQPWEAAKARFLEGLSPADIKRFRDATIENLFYDASATQKKYAYRTKVWPLQGRISSLVDALQD
jgi:hypothetical protein